MADMVYYVHIVSIHEVYVRKEKGCEFLWKDG